VGLDQSKAQKKEGGYKNWAHRRSPESWVNNGHNLLNKDKKLSIRTLVKVETNVVFV
jgi:hypothetical protein